MNQTILSQPTILGNTPTQLAVALGIALVAGLSLRILSSLLIRRLERISRWTETDLDDLAIELLRKTKGLFVLLLAIWLGSLYLALTPTADHWIRQILLVGLLIQGALWSTGVASHLLSRYRKRQVQEDPSLATALGALGILVRAVIWVLFALLILQNLGIQITALVTGLGIGGIAVALAVQNVLGDLLASLSIVLDKPFVIGDLITVGELSGTVEHVGLKTTRIRSLSGEQLIFSNSDLLGSRIRNFKRMQERRVVFTVGVTYDTGQEKLGRIPAIIREVVESQPDTRFDRCHFKAFGDFSLVFETVFFLLGPEFPAYMDAQQAINLGIYRRFEEEGIQFAFPTRTVLLGKAS